MFVSLVLHVVGIIASKMQREKLGWPTRDNLAARGWEGENATKCTAGRQNVYLLCRYSVFPTSGSKKFYIIAAVVVVVAALQQLTTALPLFSRGCKAIISIYLSFLPSLPFPLSPLLLMTRTVPQYWWWLYSQPKGKPDSIPTKM